MKPAWLLTVYGRRSSSGRKGMEERGITHNNPHQVGKGKGRGQRDLTTGQGGGRGEKFYVSIDELGGWVEYDMGGRIGGRI